MNDYPEVLVIKTTSFNLVKPVIKCIVDLFGVQQRMRGNVRGTTEDDQNWAFFSSRSAYRCNLLSQGSDVVLSVGVIMQPSVCLLLFCW